MPRDYLAIAFLLAAGASLSCLPVGHCQDASGPAGLVARLVYDRLANVTDRFVEDAGKQLSFCVQDAKADWNDAFNFSSDLGFLANCIAETNDLTNRICSAMELKFYFDSISNGGGSNFLKPNKNCNLTSWVPGCEPGWACGLSPHTAQDSKDIPERDLDCRPCCEGFFCPRGLTCMIPCPLGSYCPTAELNKISGVCEPYDYQLPPGNPNHTCGGADRWTDVQTSSQIFCPAGFYCPSTIQKIPCSNTIAGWVPLLNTVALSLLLLVIYNFSGHLLNLRQRREAKSREAAARSARESAQAHQKWKAAKDIAKKHAAGFQEQLSRTFSRKKSNKDTEMQKVLVQPKHLQSRNGELGNSFSKPMPELVEDPASDEDFGVEFEDEISKKYEPEGKEMHTRSQIFKYAYGKIEQEKALEQQNKNLTFSGIITMATQPDIKTRPVIEVAFKDLTLMLKGTKKQLLRSVTGKLKPGHVTAVMGPSGAGKTTFLNALAGKATGCDVTGLVLINGKAEPLRAYKRIIGFVPQDDIVHGNLTVEENLWFSANCRLAAGMSKADKVLVVERVIESLGLQAIRDSLVGTIEKRGISGGQRKRVNVGLEMVMEPSLLILDEPTSGLDSSSSQLLLRALRHEALEGVTICLVVHQPSYSLFKMFDDLILLAKGGLIAYHGSVKMVEEYFGGLGIDVPERVNPPDYYIDILEGIVKPSTSTGVNYKQLPVRWMLHNGYKVPQDMQQHVAMLGIPAKGEEGSNSGVGSEEQSIAGEMWQNVKGAIGKRKDILHYNFSRTKNLSNRQTPGMLKQYKYYIGRLGKQRLREARSLGVDYLILCLAGACLGMLAKVNDEKFGVDSYIYTIIAVSLLCKISALRSFSLDKLHYWRERASGMSSLAYFLAKDTIDHFNTIIKPIVYLSMFYFFNNPRSSIADNYVILLALVYCVTGIGYTFAICFQPGSAQLWSALFPVVLTLVATKKNSPKLLANICYPKWALEAFVIVNAKRYNGVWLITRCGLLKTLTYNINHVGLCIGILMAYGAIFRCIAFICLLTFQKK
ncbi:ABC transporter G family member 28-like isoform X2 [Dioscorea cayenensis subsp. rotundata]|uniref:ABC transporter G family member 28-like isoform X2 n=1 Tax=Dioscorea cayennensis subsp. rotundata TaxID=55577 RepID=A0AB40CJH7_DIOCR|nr:ABC transporter G family member 28-like isoform X2 [Dioscorea cayenensis subsp. rotundata]